MYVIKDEREEVFYLKNMKKVDLDKRIEKFVFKLLDELVIIFYKE